jgi:hypothetical protein
VSPARMAAWVAFKSRRYSATNRTCLGVRDLPLPETRSARGTTWTYPDAACRVRG